MTQPTNPWKLLRREEPFSCPYFSVRSDIVSHHDGQPRPYDSIRTKLYGVAVAPIDEHGRTVLVGQYRYVLDRFTWELPGGGARYDQPAIEAARAELSEETGYQADHWLPVIEASVAPGTSDEMARGFVAWGLHEGVPHPDPVEDFLWRWVPFTEAVEMALSGKIDNLASVGLLLGLHAKLVRGELPGELTRLLRV